MDIGKAFTFIGDDPRWLTKLLIGGVLGFAVALSIVTVIGWLVPLAIIYGYLVRLTRNVIAGEERPLPEWEDWGGLLRDGVGAFLPQLILGLALVPAMLVCLLPGIVLVTVESATTSAIGVALLVVGIIALIALGLILALAQPLIVGHYAATGSVRAALQLGDLAAMLRPSVITYLVVMLLGIVTEMIGGLGMLALGVGLPFTLFYAALVNHHLYGQAYLQARGAFPAEPSPTHAVPHAFPA
jgi:hypothetical protein